MLAAGPLPIPRAAYLLSPFLKAPRLKKRGGSRVPSTLPTCLDGARKLALVSVRFD